jgi:hypothetical protein
VITAIPATYAYHNSHITAKHKLAHNFVEMVENSYWSAMMEITKMEMDVQEIVK